MDMQRKPTHPGMILRHDYMDPLKLSVTGLASHLGISRKHLSRVLNERACVTSALALRLSRAFNTSPELWLNLQRKRDLWEAAQEMPELDGITPLMDCAGQGAKSQG